MAPKMRRAESAQATGVPPIPETWSGGGGVEQAAGGVGVEQAATCEKKVDATGEQIADCLKPLVTRRSFVMYDYSKKQNKFLLTPRRCSKQFPWPTR